MGSFYGTQFQEYTNLFHRLFFKNKNEAKTKQPSNSNFDIIAQHKKDSVTFESGNHWIDLESNEFQDGVIISHTSPSNEIKTIIKSFDKEVTEDETLLKPGESFTVSTLSFDDAGHLSTTSTKTFQLQKTEVENYNDRITSLEEDMIKAKSDISGFPSQYIEQQELNTLDKKLQDQITTNQQDIETLQKEDSNIREEFAEVDETIRKEFADADELIRQNYAPLVMTGELWEMTSASSKEDGENAYLQKFKTMSQLIGEIEDLNTTTLNQEGNVVSLCQALKSYLGDLQTDIRTMKIALDGLDARLALLEKSNT